MSGTEGTVRLTERLTLDGKCPRCGETPAVERHEWTGHTESLVCVGCEIQWAPDGGLGVEA